MGKIIEYGEWEKKFKPVKVNENGAYFGCFVDSGENAMRELVEAMSKHVGQHGLFIAALQEGRIGGFGDLASNEVLRAIFGDENYIRDHVWTVVETDGAWSICPGWAFVNRQGYILTSEPCNYLQSEIDEVYDLTDWPDEAMPSWEDALKTKADEEDADDEQLNINESISIARSLIQCVLLETGFFDKAYISEEKGEGVLHLSIAPAYLGASTKEYRIAASELDRASATCEKQPSTVRLSIAILDSVIPCEGQRYEPFDPDKVKVEVRESTIPVSSSIYYDEKFVVYGSNITLDDKTPEEAAMRYAKQLYYIGHEHDGIAPICGSYPYPTHSASAPPRP